MGVCSIRMLSADFCCACCSTTISLLAPKRPANGPKLAQRSKHHGRSTCREELAGSWDLGECLNKISILNATGKKQQKQPVPSIFPTGGRVRGRVRVRGPAVSFAAKSRSRVQSYTTELHLSIPIRRNVRVRHALKVFIR